MQRKDGQIDVLNMLGIELNTVLDGTTEMEYRACVELYEKISSRDDIEIIHYHLGTALTFSFTHDGEKYFFKYDSLAAPENELFAYNVASRLGIEAVNYDLAVCGPYKGVISKNFKEPTTTYIDAFDLLADAHHDELVKFDGEEDPLTKEDNIKKYLFNFHSLEGIWEA